MRLFKTLMIIFIGFTLLSLSNVPKSFEVIGESAKTIVLEENEKLEISEIKFKNTTEQNLSLKWTLVENSFPKEWDYSMCAFGKCQIGIPKGGTLRKLLPGKSGFMAIHVFPKGNKGQGVVTFKLEDPTHESASELLVFKVKVE